MNRILKCLVDRKDRFSHLVALLTGLWIFLIPFGKGEQVPAIFLAVCGLYALIKTKGACTKPPASKGFLLLTALYLLPIAVSMTDAPSLSDPLTVFLTGAGCGLAGISIIHAIETNPKTLSNITLTLAVVVGFWFLDAGIQAVFGRDLFGMTLEGDRLSGPWRKKTQMGYYSGPFSALLLMFVLQKKWKPVLLWAMFLFISIVVLLNNSRGGWVMYAIVSVVFGFQAFINHLKHKTLMITGLICIATILVAGLYLTSKSFQARANQTLIALQGDKNSINKATSGRLPIWEASWNIIKEHPLNGVGAKNFTLIARDYWPDGYTTQMNTYYPHQYVLEYAVGTGLIGILCLVASTFICLYWWKKAGTDQQKAAIGFGLTLAALYFPLNTHKEYFGSELAVSLWILIALYVAAVRQRSNDPADAA